MTIPARLEPSLPSWARLGEKRLAHVIRVAELVARWADRMAVPPGERSRWLKAAWLHDALRDADPAELARWTSEPGIPVELLHGPAAARRAEADGESDRAVVDAVRYHSVGSADWDIVGQVLYCADFLEPGRKFEPTERALLAERFPDDPSSVFRDVVTRRVLHLVRSAWPIPEPTYRLWNSLARSSSAASR